MSVYLCIPSARPPEEANPVLQKWRDQGYKIALFIDRLGDRDKIYDFYIRGLETPPYPGYARAVNALVHRVAQLDPSAEWFVAGGDDTLPDPNHTADEIAAECTEHFGGTFGVVQPTGDRFAGGSIDRIAGSPWLGREWCERIYGGAGPLFSGYKHMHVDEELLCVAEMLGVYWRRPDLVHFHKHFQRESEAIDSNATPHVIPPHLVYWNSPEHWQESSTLFRERKLSGFPGHEPAGIGAMVNA